MKQASVKHQARFFAWTCRRLCNGSIGWAVCPWRSHSCCCLSDWPCRISFARSPMWTELSLSLQYLNGVPWRFLSLLVLHLFTQQSSRADPVQLPFTHPYWSDSYSLLPRPVVFSLYALAAPSPGYVLSLYACRSLARFYSLSVVSIHNAVPSPVFTCFFGILMLSCGFHGQLVCSVYIFNVKSKCCILKLSQACDKWYQTSEAANTRLQRSLCNTTLSATFSMRYNTARTINHIKTVTVSCKIHSLFSPRFRSAMDCLISDPWSISFRCFSGLHSDGRCIVFARL